VACLVLSGVTASTAVRAVEPGQVQFDRDILPILSENCFACHGPDAKARKAKLRLDLKETALRKTEAVIVPGKSGESELIERVACQDDDEVMPPPKSGKKLTAQQIDLLKKWVDQGAQWSKHWAFEPVRRPAAPSVRVASGVINPIDRFVLARLETEGLAPSARAERTTLIRRLSLDLLGFPPTPEEVDAFLGDESPNAYDSLADRLLASPHYGERMAMDWLDGARYADTNGFQNDFARTMWPWRDWVIAAYNRNQPFDRFVIDQIAGDLLPGASLDQRIATGFSRNNRTVTEAGSIDEEYRVENTVDRVETTSMVFLGLTLGCARCHDHKFDPVTQAEFYQFYGFFNSVNEQGVYTETRGNVPPLIKLPMPEDRARLGELEIAIAAAKVSGDKPWIEKTKKARDEYDKRITSVMVMEDRPRPRDTFLLKRGQYDMPDTTKKLEPGVPSCLPSLPAGVARNRLGLAQWLAAPENPLTARVIVNRIWQHHFGVGLVKTAENFGIQGEPPSHPELLDWLASELVRTGWDVKAIHRLIVTSATYRQASNAKPALVARDPENRLLARGPRFRLQAELLRDNALAIGGSLVRKIGGPSIKPYQPAGLWEELAGGAGEAPYVQDKGAKLYGRSLYVYRKRTVPYPGMATFDAPSREICQVKRARTNTPLQALELLNDVTYVEAARQLAQLAIEQGGSSPEERITFAFRRALARMPAPRELQILRRGLDRYRKDFEADKEAAMKLIRHGESPPGSAVDPVLLAAYTATASVILNLDETITLE
jgi:mono/diheme cytochrome c family protein